MNKKAKSIVFVALLSVWAYPLWAAEKATLLSTPAVPQQTSYQLPENIKEERLIRSAIIIACGRERGMGIAIGKKHILTAAHVMAYHVMTGSKVRAFAVKKFAHAYTTSASPCGTNSQGQHFYQPDYLTNNNFRELIINQVYFPEGTSIQKSNEQGTLCDLSSIMKGYEEAMKCGLENVEKLANSGILKDIMINNNGDEIQIKTCGPDVAILECDQPHGLPSLEISDPIQEDRSLLHIIGLAGIRYSDAPPYEAVDGVPCYIKRKPANSL